MGRLDHSSRHARFVVLVFLAAWIASKQGPVFCMLSPSHPAKAEDVKITIDGYAQGRSIEGPVYYSGLISNSCSQPVMARLMAVYFPEFQSSWEM
jgi:hypothetical protein